jgi:hypothetical protein
VRVSVFVGGAREAEGAERGRERSACRGPLTHTRPAYATRFPLVAHATATAHATRPTLDGNYLQTRNWMSSTQRS